MQTIKKLIKAAVVFGWVLMAAPALNNIKAQSLPKAKYVVLITVDGFRPEFYLDSTYGMFTVRQLMQNGVAAKGVNPVFPSVTYPDHTTMISGVSPGKHGIVYNTPFEAEGSTGKWLWDYNLIKVPTIWTAMHDAGKKTACVRWPVTYNAPVDYRIAEYWDYKNMQDARPYTAEATNPKTLWQEVQDSATGYLQALDIAAENNELISDENMGRITSYLIHRYKPNFTAVHLACTDHYEHAFGREGYMVRAAVAGADRAIKSIIEGISRAKIQDSTLVIVLGDHGFENIYRSFNPNYLLKQNGLMDDIQHGQWKAQFHSQGGGTFLHVKDTADKATIQKVISLLHNLPDSVKQYFAIVDKQTLNAAGASPEAALALTGLKGTSFGGTAKELLTYFDKVKGTHGFYPDHQQIRTGLVAFGPGLQQGVVIPEMNMVDVAPLIVYLTGIHLPGMDGKLYPQMFK